jgi:iron(III) transport system substrate-binding protein
MTKRSATHVVVALVLLLAGCGSPTAGTSGSAAPGSSAAQQVYDQINGLSGDERDRTLRDLATKEGQLALYTSNPDIDDVVKAFED